MIAFCGSEAHASYTVGTVIIVIMTRSTEEDVFSSRMHPLSIATRGSQGGLRASRGEGSLMPPHPHTHMRQTKKRSVAPRSPSHSPFPLLIHPLHRLKRVEECSKSSVRVGAEHTIDGACVPIEGRHSLHGLVRVCARYTCRSHSG